VTWIKICGITSKDDAEAAIDAGASAIGLVFAISPRKVTLEKAIGIAAIARNRAQVVGVFRDPAQVEFTHSVVRFDLIQIHHPSRLEVDLPVLRAIRPELIDRNGLADGETLLVDSSEGRGVAFDWRVLKKRAGRFVIAGGLNAHNVGVAMSTARPFGVDVSTGVEAGPGRKDRHKMRDFVEAVRRADGSL
jgi:phosphoribosylanthranilate isomerase